MILQLGDYAQPGKSCQDIRKITKTLRSGEYWIEVDNTGPMRVYCDMTTHEGN